MRTKKKMYDKINTRAYQHKMKTNQLLSTMCLLGHEITPLCMMVLETYSGCCRTYMYLSSQIACSCTEGQPFLFT